MGDPGPWQESVTDRSHPFLCKVGGIARVAGCCDPDIVKTNLFHQVSAFGASGQELADYLAGVGILVFAGEPTVRLATHRMVTSEDIDQVLKAFDRLHAER